MQFREEKAHRIMEIRDIFQNVTMPLRGTAMNFRENLKMFVSYLKEFPSPSLMIRHAKLTTSCRELKDSVHKLQQENACLKEKLELEGKYVRNNGAYFFETPEGHEAPFCSRCWDLRGRLVRLSDGLEGGQTCPFCAQTKGL